MVIEHVIHGFLPKLSELYSARWQTIQFLLHAFCSGVFVDSSPEFTRPRDPPSRLHLFGEALSQVHLFTGVAPGPTCRKKVALLNSIWVIAGRRGHKKDRIIVMPHDS